MFKLFLDSNRCKGCGLCESVCPKKIIKISNKEFNEKGYFYAEIIDESKCIGCTFCAQICPDLVITITGERGEKCG